MDRVTEGQLLAKAISQTGRLSILFSKVEVAKALMLLRALNAIDFVLQTPRRMLSKAFVLALAVALFTFALYEDTPAAVAPLPVILLVLPVGLPALAWYLGRRAVRRRYLPEAVHDLEHLLTNDSTYAEILSRIREVDLEPLLIERIAPFVPQLQMKGGT